LSRSAQTFNVPQLYRQITPDELEKPQKKQRIKGQRAGQLGRPGEKLYNA